MSSEKFRTILGVFLLSLGLICEWATLPLVIMFPLMVAMYYRLARREERDMELEFGQEYVAYKARTGMFLPRFSGARSAAQG